MSTDATVNEKTTLLVLVSFFDDTGTAVTPSAATYRIHDRDSGALIVASTALSGLSTTKTIEVTSTQNALLNGADASEVHVLTLEFDYGSSRHGTAEYTWTVKGLAGVA